MKPLDLLAVLACVLILAVLTLCAVTISNAAAVLVEIVDSDIAANREREITERARTDGEQHIRFVIEQQRLLRAAAEQAAESEAERPLVWRQ